MKKYIKTLCACPLFLDVEEENLPGLLGCLGGKIERFDRRETIMAEGSPSRHIGVLLSGSAQVLQVDYLGNRSILSRIGPSQVFAEAFACAGVTEIPVTVIAAEESEVLLIDCYRVLHTCVESCDFHRKLIYNLMKDLATKTLLFHQRAEILSRRSTREKLMAYLMAEAKKAKSRRFRIPFDRQELADYLEVDRSGLSVEIGKLRREGVLQNRRNDFELL